MLTKVILEGPLGKRFGRVWNIAVDSPSHALRLIDANKPGVFVWIRDNLRKYANYRIICEYEDGRKEYLDKDEYALRRKAKMIRFVPIVEGSGDQTLRFVAAAVLFVAGFFSGPYAPAVWSMSASLFLTGVANMLAPKPDNSKTEGKTSYYFDGPTNTTQQGVPVQLTYGRCLVGSHTISAAVTVDQLL
jgi:predicted phage tail protein